MKSLSKYFRDLRMDENHHIGLGDIRLTIAQQDEICDIAAENIAESINYYSKQVFNTEHKHEHPISIDKKNIEI
jgi:hypothetical protein